MRLSVLVSVLALALGCTASGGRPGASAARVNTGASRTEKSEVLPVTLHIDLQDGFQNDEVTVRLDGKQVFHKTVSTDARISRADGFEATSSAKDATLEIELPKKHVSAKQPLKPASTPHVGISLHDGKPQFRLAAEPFLYM